MAGLPVIVTGALEEWPALRKWSFEFLAERYGSDLALAWGEGWGQVARLTKLRSYIRFLKSARRDLPGMWVDGQTLLPLEEGAFERKPPYLLGWQGFDGHPELSDDICPAPEFVSDWVLSLDRPLRDLLARASSRAFWSIYIGVSGSGLGLHTDFWQTHGSLAQIRGRKRVILFPPDQSDLVYEGAVDPEAPDLVVFPRYGLATPYEGTLEEGDYLFIPRGWWHAVRNLEASITVSHNFFNQTNAGAYAASVLRNLPDLVKVLGQTPSLREAIGVRWESLGVRREHDR